MRPQHRRFYFFTSFLLFSLSYVSAQNPVYKDKYGREVVNNGGRKINYPKLKTESLSTVGFSTLKEPEILAFTSGPVQGKDTVRLEASLLYSVMGTSIGYKSMHSLDINADGIPDLICTGSTQTFGSGSFWYILNYNAEENSYLQVWSSPIFEVKISTLEVADLNGDGTYEILMGLENGTLQIYDARTKMLIKESKFTNERLNSIVYEDADNDSEKDIVISCTQHSYILNPDSLGIKFEIAKGANEIRVGNVDDDGMNEIVLSSGGVYRLTGSGLSTLWNFEPRYDGYIELSDIDNDSKQEIIDAEAWYYIYVYDADEQSSKYAIPSDLDINALLLTDVNGDGLDEIIYGDGQWGSLYCHDAVTGKEIWSVNNPEHGVSGINFADIDNDGIQELIWGAGLSSTGPDYLYVYDVSSRNLEWRSDDIVGPFYGIDTGDVDGDGKPEVVAVSYESESGYGSGVVFIFDPLTKKIKWKSDGSFLKDVWTGVFTVKVVDIDDDGTKEIVIAAGYLYTGEIWIIDGKTHTIKSSHIFSSEDIDEFSAMSTGDIDNDGTKEIIALSDDNLYVIDPANWLIKWTAVIKRYGQGKPVIRCADINGNGQMEIIVCKGYLTVINSSDHSAWISTEMNFLNLDIADINGDGISDPVVSSTAGQIIGFNGSSKERLLTLEVEHTPINAIRMMEINGSPLFIYSCDGRINYYIDDEKRNVSQYFANVTGDGEGMKLLNSDEGTDLILGTSVSVLQISGESFNCTSMSLGVETTEASCDADNGVIRLNISGGTPPYTCFWPDEASPDSLTGLPPGTYRVKVLDDKACIREKSVTLERSYIEATVAVTDEGCDRAGALHVELNHYNPTCNIAWSTGQNGPDVTGLVAGTYEVTISDSKNCTLVLHPEIKKDQVTIGASVRNVGCYGLHDGFINLYIGSGAAPFQIEWADQDWSMRRSNLGAGNYQVKVTDTLGCESVKSFEISQPDAITYDLLTSPDIHSTANWEGKIMIENIEGGSPPYTIYWPRFNQQSDFLEILPEGRYAFILVDAMGCAVQDTAEVQLMDTVPELLKDDMLRIYPNPAAGVLTLDFDEKNIPGYRLEMIDVTGSVVKSKTGTSREDNSMDLSGFKPGVYILRITIKNQNYYRKIIVNR